MRAWIVTIAAVLTVTGISSPRVALRSGHLLLITIALAIAVVVVKPVFAAIEQRRSEPFVPIPPRTPRATMPNEMAQIVDAFTNRPDTSGESEPVPPHLIRRITTVATGRIVDHHHLHIGDTDDHPAIRKLVSPLLWVLLCPPVPVSTTAPSLPVVPVVPFDVLGGLIDELERL